MIVWRIAGGVFRPRLLPTLLTAVMLVILTILGLWQIERLHWKQNLIAIIDARTHAQPVDIGDKDLHADLDYDPVTVFGTFQNEHNFYLFSISLTGQGGYHVLTPFLLTDGRYMLVDRGWIPYARKQNADFSQPTAPLSIGGFLRQPEHFLMQSKNDPAHNDWYWIDLPAMAQSAGIPAFEPYILEINDAPNPGGYPVGGQTRVTLPNNHLSYAVTWFGMIPVLLVIYGLSSFRKNAAD